MALIRNRLQLNPNEQWVQAASEKFEAGVVSQVPQPTGSFFVCVKEKLLYAPIAKCGCTSIKRLMVELSNLEHEHTILQYGVHRVTDGFVTGAQLKDYDSETVRHIVNANDYYKFAVIREPVRRIISAYTEKFLVNRTNPGNLLHTLDVVRAVRCHSSPDPEDGISFREFVQYLVNTDPTLLDPHWAPQYLYLQGVDSFDDIFTMEQLDALADRLSERTGRDIQLGKHNASVNAGGDAPTHRAGGFADKRPGELTNIDNLSADDFMAPDLVAALQNYYTEDVTLYQAATSGLQGYTPPPTASNATAPRVRLTTAPEIARCITLYTKGFFALDASGEGTLPALIINTSSYTIDFSKLPRCSALYSIFDSEGNTLLPLQEQLIEPRELSADGTVRFLVRIKVPTEQIDAVKTARLALKFGDEFLVEDVSPFHVAAAQRAIVPG